MASMLDNASGWVSLEQLIHYRVFSTHPGWVQRLEPEYHAVENWLFENPELGITFQIKAIPGYSNHPEEKAYQGNLLHQDVQLVFRRDDEVETTGVLLVPKRSRPNRLITKILVELERVLDDLAEGKSLANAVRGM